MLLAALCTQKMGLYCMTAITVVKCSKWPRRFLNKEVLPLMLKLSLMKPNGPQVNTPGGTIDLLVMG